MIIPVLGMDPSFLHWGLAEGNLDLLTGILTITNLEVIEPLELGGKQIRVNSNDQWKAEQIAARVIPAVQGAKVIFAEVPVGSQSARAMAGYGICVGILGSIRAMGHSLIEVTATEVKVALANDKNATKKQMITAATALYPAANFPSHGGKITNKAEHAADAIGTIHAGAITPVFQNLMRLFEKV